MNNQMLSGSLLQQNRRLRQPIDDRHLGQQTLRDAIENASKEIQNAFEPSYAKEKAKEEKAA